MLFGFAVCLCVRVCCIIILHPGVVQSPEREKSALPDGILLRAAQKQAKKARDKADDLAHDQIRNAKEAKKGLLGAMRLSVTFMLTLDRVWGSRWR